MVTSDFRPEVELWPLCTWEVKNSQYNPYLWPNRRNFHAIGYWKSEARNSMVTSDFTPEMEIRPFRACAMKNVQYNPYLQSNRRNFRVAQEIGVKEHDGDVRF